MKNPEYEKIPTALNYLGLSEKTIGQLNKQTWIVTEKIHGANFSFVYQDNHMMFCKRKEYLKWNDDFFGFQKVVHELEDKVIRLFEHLYRTINTDRLILYGELFGGSYPHPMLLPERHVYAIQTGVYYSPTIHFCAFDIAFENEGNKHYLNYSTSIGVV